LFGPQRKSLDILFGTTKFKLGGTTITADKSGAIISASVVTILLVVALVRSRIGLGVRALTQNPEGAALVGIGRKQAAFAILIVSGALAGLAAVLLSQIFYPEPNIGYLPLLKGLIVALLGGLGSISGAVTQRLRSALPRH
jgi:branched-chain amino acid transport system permease protein